MKILKNVMIETMIMEMDAVHNVKYSQDISVPEFHLNAKNYQIGRNFKKLLKKENKKLNQLQILLKLKIKIYH